MMRDQIRGAPLASAIGYTEDELASKRSSAARRNGRPTIGYLVSEIQRDFALWPWQGMVDAARQHDVNFITLIGGILRPLNGFGGQANVLCDLASAECLDGLIIWPPVMGVYRTKPEIEEFCRRYYSSMPVVLLQEVIEDVPRVTIDDYQGCYLAVDHLIEAHNYRRIAFAGMFEHHVGFRERYRAYTDVLAARDLPVEAQLTRAWFPDEVIYPSGRIYEEVFSTWLREAVEAGAEAIVGVCDTIALEIMEILKVQGIRIPEDVAVASFDDFKQSQAVTPPLTTANPSFYELGQQAIEILLASLEGQSVPEETVVAPRLMVRQSCGCLDPVVAQAVAGPVKVQDEPFMVAWVRHREDIIAEIVQVVGVSEAAAEWTGPLVDRFIAEATGEQQGGFLSVLGEVLHLEFAASRDVAAWQGAVSVLRRFFLPYLSGDALLQAEDLWGQARVAIGQAAVQLQTRQTLRVEHQTQVVQEISQALLSTFEADQLMNVLVESLPRLGIQSCYLALYEDPLPYQYPQPAPEWSRLVLAYHEKGRAGLEPDGRRFRTCELVPQELLPQARQYNLVVEPLYFQENQLGYILLEVGPRDGSVYEALRAQISSVLQGANLVRRVRERSAELVRQQYILSTFMENVPDHIYFKDLQGRITRANKAHAINLALSDPAEEIGKRDFDFFPEEQARVKYDQEQAIIRTGQPILNWEEPDGSGGWVLTTKMPLRDEHGHIVGTFGISRDITDLKQAQAALERAYAEVEQQVRERTIKLQHEVNERQRVEDEREQLIVDLEAKNAELERFTYTVSHDLKAPLITIRGFLGLLEKDARAGNVEQMQSDMARIVGATNKMQRLLNELLELSRLGRMVNPAEAVPFDLIAREAINLVQGQLDQHQVRVDLAPDLPTVYGDHVRLVEVVQNLVDNAAKFMGDQPEPRVRIGITGGEQSGLPIFFVQDNGQGIAPEHSERIFGLFSKLDAASEGTGVGLALVKRIIDLHGGRIWVESDGAGQGATFFFTLPRAAPGGRQA